MRVKHSSHLWYLDSLSKLEHWAKEIYASLCGWNREAHWHLCSSNRNHWFAPAQWEPWSNQEEITKHHWTIIEQWLLKLLKSHLGANSGGFTSKTKRNWSCHKCHGKFQTLWLEPFLTRNKCPSSSCSMVWVTFGSAHAKAEFVNSWSKQGQLCQVGQPSFWVWLLGWRYSPGTHPMPSQS